MDHDVADRGCKTGASKRLCRTERVRVTDGDRRRFAAGEKENEMSAITEHIKESLFSCQDLGYRDFQARLIPTIDKETIIGVRTPRVRALAKEVAKDPQIGAFLCDLPHRYYEENNVHVCVIGQMKDYESCLRELEKFLPYIDNWATCDMEAPKVFRKHTQELLTPIRGWLASGQTYTVRFAIRMLMCFYLDQNFRTEYLELVAGVRSQEYYVNMMIAWYFATALARQYEAALPYIEQRRLADWTHNKTIQKAQESLRITPEQKAYLKTWKV